jgi:putative metallohydrolase (TIGR04338 family)
MTSTPVLYIPDRERGYRQAHGYSDKAAIERMGFEIEERSTRTWHVTRVLKPTTHRFGAYRDWQKSRLYRAEYGLRPEQSFATIEEMQAYINMVWESLGLTSLGGQINTPPNVMYQPSRSTRSVSDAHAILNRIRMSRGKWSHNPVVLLHEAAHVMSGNGDGHGPMFTRTLVDLFTKFISPEMGGQLLEKCQTGRELTHHAYNDGDWEKRTRRYIVEVAGPRYGLARFGPRTGFMTGVPTNVEAVSPFVRSALKF